MKSMKHLALAAALALGMGAAQAQMVNRITGPSTLDVQGSSNVNVEGQKVSYFASLGNNTPAATPTDVAIIAGSATKTVKITRITVTVQATTGAIGEYRLVLRSGGTQSAVNTAFANGTHSGPFDSTSAASTVIANGLSGVYTANPASTGTVVGSPVNWTINIPTPATGAAVVMEYTCGPRPAQCITLRGATQFLAVNGNGHTLAAGEKFGVSYEWTEE